MAAMEVGVVRRAQSGSNIGWFWANTTGTIHGFGYSGTNNSIRYGTLSGVSLSTVTDDSLITSLLNQSMFSLSTTYANITLSNVSLTKSWGSSGYWKGPDGLMLAWGEFTATGSASGGRVSFPTSFYSNPYVVACSCRGATGTSVAMAAIISQYASYFMQRGTWASNSSGYGQEVYDYVAVGRWK